MEEFLNIFEQIGSFLVMLIELIGGVIVGIGQLLLVIPSAIAFLGGSLAGLPAPLQSVVPIAITIAILKVILPGKLGSGG